MRAGLVTRQNGGQIADRLELVDAGQPFDCGTALLAGKGEAGAIFELAVQLRGGQRHLRVALGDVDLLFQRGPILHAQAHMHRAAAAFPFALDPLVDVAIRSRASTDIVALREEMRAELKELHDRIGVTAIYVTHDQAEAMVLSDRIVVMGEGRIRQIGTPRELYERPADAYVARFIGRTNLLKSKLLEWREDVALIRIEDIDCELRCPAARNSGGTATGVLSVRPEAVLLKPASQAAPGALVGRVRAARYLGNLQNYRVSIGSTVIDVEQSTAREWGVGDAVGVEIDAARRTSSPTHRPRCRAPLIRCRHDFPGFVGFHRQQSRSGARACRSDAGADGRAVHAGHAAGGCGPGLPRSLSGVLVVYREFLLRRPRVLSQVLRQFWSMPGLQAAFTNTALLVAGTVPLAFAFALPLAWITARTDTPLRGVIGLAALLPFITPPLIGAVAWSLLGAPRTGLVNVAARELGATAPVLNIFGMGGLIFVSALYLIRSFSWRRERRWSGWTPRSKTPPPSRAVGRCARCAM